MDEFTRCDRSDHDHGSLEEARQCWRDAEHENHERLDMDCPACRKEIR